MSGIKPYKDLRLDLPQLPSPIYLIGASSCFLGIPIFPLPFLVYASHTQKQRSTEDFNMAAPLSAWPWDNLGVFKVLNLCDASSFSITLV